MGCYSDDLLFIHIPKTGGWSCKNYLREHVPGVVFPEDKESGLPIGHVPLRDIQAFTGRKLDSFEKIIAVIRNPYEQQLSQWMFWRDRRARGGDHFHDYVAANHVTVESFLLDKRNDFHLWYEHHPTIGLKLRDPGLVGERLERGIYWYWLSVDGELPPNLQVIKAEELDEAFPEAVHSFTNKSQRQPMPHDNSTRSRRSFTEYYTHLACALVEDKFKWAFDNYYERLSERET